MTGSRDRATWMTGLGLALLAGLAGCRAEPPEHTAAALPAVAPARSICIKPYEIDHTRIPNDSTILFYMRGGRILKNSLPFPCPGLSFSGGFKYTTDIDEICSNLQTIRVIEQGGGPRLGAVCQLGAFTPYVPPPGGPAQRR